MGGSEGFYSVGEGEPFGEVEGERGCCVNWELDCDRLAVELGLSVDWCFSSALVARQPNNRGRLTPCQIAGLCKHVQVRPAADGLESTNQARSIDVR